jgi:uncharacterized membrane protein YhaH (DUF805 family)
LGRTTCRSRKFHPARIRTIRQNQGIIRRDACHPPSMALVVVLEGSIMFTLNWIFKGAEPHTEEATKQLAFFEDRLWVIMTISVWWPSWALTLKRLHDLGLGWKALLFFVALDVLSVVLTLLHYKEIDTQVTLFSLGLTVMLGAIKGTTGSNRYGPDPLGK